MAADNIDYLPSDGLSYDTTDSVYWDPSALNQEIVRTFEICHGCRMCFKYCDTFPSLFDLIDNKHDGDVRGINAAETDALMDSCFQCKLCEVQCPYTVRDQHEFQLDFPKLVHRYTAQRTRRQGLSTRDSILSNPDGAAKMARATLGLANVMNRNSVHRWFMEKLLGVHRDKELPDFASQTFDSWAKSAGKLSDGPGGEAVLFPTCYVQHNEPEIGRDTLEVMEKNQVDCRCTSKLVCCGMPAWERGDLDSVRKQAHQNLNQLMPFVEAGAKVIAINPTCSMMMRREYVELLEDEDRERAKQLAEAIVDPSELVWSIRKEERFNTDFKSTPGNKVSYHAPCHLRTQGVGFKGRDLMKKIPDVKPATVMECCGHDGTYAMTVEGFEPSQRIGKKAFDGMKNPSADVWATDCPLAAIQFSQHAGVRPMHPMTVLARAYRSDGFPTKVAPPEPEKTQ